MVSCSTGAASDGWPQWVDMLWKITEVGKGRKPSGHILIYKITPTLPRLFIL